MYTGKARLRARDIRLALQNKNLDPAVIQTLETLAEQDGTLRKQIDMLAELINKCTAQLDQLIDVIGVMKDRVEPFVNAQKEIGKIAIDRIKVMEEDEASEN